MSKNKRMHSALVAERERLIRCLRAIDDVLVNDGLAADTPEQYRHALHDMIAINVMQHCDPAVNHSAPVGREQQVAVADWVIRAFGPKAMKPAERGRRVLEESAEFARAVGVTVQEASTILIEVYHDDHIGDPAQEIGGVGLTVLAASASLQLDFAEEANRELRRVESKDLDEMRRRQMSKANRGMSE